MIPVGAGPMKVRVIISRMGGETVVVKSLVQSEDEGDDALNNSVQTTEEYVNKSETEARSKILCARFYPSVGKDPEVEQSGSGAVTSDQPRLAFPTHDESVTPEEEDRVTYDGTEYELGSPKHYTNFVTFEAQNVND